MKINKNNIPIAMEGPGTVMRTQNNFGKMTVSFNELPKGTDFSPLLNGLDNNSCHCPHWGYVLSGSLLVKYDNGSEEILTEGDVYFLPNGHTAIVQEDIMLIEFSPSKEFSEVMTHVGKKMAELG
ncbi:cupin domain-containing protein [Galbibacter pacificus]|uniref:Cupin domain-containing protein n=1 Tax=Galbibacter pacificus TaxID=2996052 RepID=A0ABT6FVA3_9FLAO|nr:cupin domain-containing protein [Galbibacter pacificus]MDG3583884.1 cupin domain-containing protein [Galbibacter pacificus]MDG3587198.1 cupin domain-containing protein [Galbibacter pacificus]